VAALTTVAQTEAVDIKQIYWRKLLKWQRFILSAGAIDAF